MMVSRVMTLRMLPLNVWLLLGGASGWSIPAARIMATTTIGPKSGSLRAGREQDIKMESCACQRRGRRTSQVRPALTPFYGSPKVTFCDVRFDWVRRIGCPLTA